MSEKSVKGVIPARMRADFPPATVVFLIGMRINSFRRVRQWLPVVKAMPNMLIELSKHPELGLLGARSIAHRLRQRDGVRHGASDIDRPGTAPNAAGEIYPVDAC